MVETRPRQEITRAQRASIDAAVAILLKNGDIAAAHALCSPLHDMSACVSIIIAHTDRMQTLNVVLEGFISNA